MILLNLRSGMTSRMELFGCIRTHVRERTALNSWQYIIRSEVMARGGTVAQDHNAGDFITLHQVPFGWFSPTLSLLRAS